MAKFLTMMMVIMLPAVGFIGCALAHAADAQDEPPRLSSKVSLVRGVLKRLDTIHDQLLVHAFGGRDIRIAFDPRTEFLAENTHSHLSSIPAGSVVSVDTAIEGGKLFARSVRMSSSNGGEVDGQVVGYNAAQSQLTLRDPLTPEGISLRLTSSTTVLKHDQPAASQSLSAGMLAPGMLVRVWFSPAENVASKVEVLAERGNSFTFAGHVVAVDLHSRVVTVSNDTDKSLRELAIGTLDSASLQLLTEGSDVSVQAEFDGDRYNARAVTLLSRNP
jgi:hypothetical protein